MSGTCTVFFKFEDFFRAVHFGKKVSANSGPFQWQAMCFNYNTFITPNHS